MMKIMTPAYSSILLLCSFSTLAQSTLAQTGSQPITDKSAITFEPDLQRAEQQLADYDAAIAELEDSPDHTKSEEEIELQIDNLIYAKKFHQEINGLPMFTFLGGPAYTPEQGILVAAGGLYSFKTNRNQQALQRSSLSLFLVGNAVDNKFGYGLRAKHNLFWNNDDIQFIGMWNAGMQTKHYWGIGYDNAQQYELGDDTKQNVLSTTYESNLNFRLYNKWFLGPAIRLNYYNPQNDTPAEAIKNDDNYLAFADKPFTFGLGAALQYDSRDVAVNAWQGQFAKLQYVVFDQLIGSQSDYQKLDIQHRFYHSIAKGNVIATYAAYQQAWGDIPYYDMPTLGGAMSMRGFYQGQYRDQTTAEFTTEYRHTFKRSNGELSNHGATIWTGIGSVAPTAQQLSEHLLLSYGVGYRYEVQPRMNVRLDLGFSEHGMAFYFNFTEAF
ncbi:outer membrane protein assembly factor [Photobacterium swingsii]|uniref:BamA/TamA family outer membrane protein n=2 Tax=Photobacterium swingsii TaxID=680026 RepID=UPI003D0E61A0